MASADMVAEENVVSAGDEGLDGTLGAEVTAAGDALEATASAPGDAALETVDIPVYQEKGSGDSDVKGFSREDGRLSEVTELDAQRDDPEKYGNTATELPREVVPEATEYGTKPDDQDGDKSDSRPEGLDPDIGDAGAIEDEVEVRSSRSSESTDSVPSDDAAGVDKHYSADYESPEGMAATETEAKAVVTGEDVLEATASAPGDAALETVEIPVYQEKGSDDADVKGFSREDGRLSEVTELDAQRDDQEKDDNTATELPREVVPEATEYATKPDDPDGDKSDLRLERLDPDIRGGSAEVDAKHEVVGDESPSKGISTEDAQDVGSVVEASRVDDKHYTGEGNPLAEVASTDVATEENVVSAGDEGLDGTLGAGATASAPGDAALETLDVPVYQEKGSDDADVKGFSREDGRLSEVTELDAQRDDPEKDGNTATELPREVVPEATEYGTKPDDPDGDKGDSRPERLDPDIGGGSAEVDAKHEVVGDESPVVMVSTEDVPNVEASGVKGKDYSEEGKPLAEVASTDVVAEENVVSAGDEGLDSTLGAGVTAVGDVLEAAASVHAALETVDVPVDKEGDKRDPDEVKAGKKKEEREEIGLIVPNIDQKTELEGDKSEEAPAISGIKQDAVVDSRIIEESRVEEKHYTGEGKPLAEAALADGVTEEKVVSAGDEGLDGTLGAGVTAVGDVLEAAALASEDATLETLDIPVYQEKGSDDADVKGFSGEDAIVSEAATRPDDQEKDGNTATELPREVVPEATEYGTKPDDPDGDKGDSRPERLDPYIGDAGAAIEDEVEVRSSRGSESTYSVPSDDAAGVDKHYSADDESPEGMAAIETEAKAVVTGEDVLEATASVPGDAALETVDVPVYQEKGSDDADVKGFSREDGIVTEAGTRPDDPDGDKSDSRPERLDPDIGGGSAEVDAKHEVVGDESPVVMVSTEDVPNVEASGVKGKDYSEEGKPLAETSSTDVVAEEKVVSAGGEGLDGTLGAGATAGGDVLEATASVQGDAALETVDIPVYQEKGSGDFDVKGFSREDGIVTEAATRPDDQEKDGNTATELPREVVPEATEYGTKPDDPDGDKGDSGSEKSGSDSGDAESENESKERYFWDERYGEVLFADYGKVEDGGLSEVTELDAQRDDQEKDGNTATELPREVVPEATEYGTQPDDPDGDKGDSGSEKSGSDSGDADVKGFSREDGIVTEAGIRPDDQDGDKSDLRLERLDPDIRGGSAEVDAKHEVVGDESPSKGISTEDAQDVGSVVEASRVDDKHYTGEGNPLAEVASTDVATEENVVSAGDEGLDGTLGAGATASAPGDAALETLDVPVYQEKGSDDADVKGFSREDGIVTEAGIRPDDQDGDKSDLRPERLDPETGDAAIEDEVEVRSSGGSESTYSVPSYDAAGVDKHYSADDESPEGIAATATEAKAVVTGEDVLEATASVQGDAALETVDIPVYQEKGSDDADVKDPSREDAIVSEVGTRPDDPDGDKSDLRPERLDPYIGDAGAIEDEVEVRSSKKTLLMRRGQIDVSVVSTATKDIASEARKSDIEKEALDRDVSSRVAVPIEDRGLLKTESNVATATQKQVDADASELLPGTSSNKKKAKEHKGKSKKKKSKRKEEQLSGVSTDEILKGLFFAMTSENISHQDKSLPEKDQEQDASKETHQDEKKKSQEKAREEKAQKQKSSISKMQRKISKLKGRIAQGNLTEGKIQVLRNKIAEIEACINELDS
ncbi:type IV secretion system VirB6 family domain protein [Anaplasma phagocytophilum str. ApMUC09]|uniref:Type IV secretion system VirB6 family domain protein n=1 Tax=Anaplasma phagocytophilum str. ApMUC09 TaxID=1359152 RepID=A0A0F3N6B6_ANAPH|nr:type IV secretion system VirB6 family domain protein [Anaplasma phagocytophilum str. ApMUC09]